MIRSRIIPSLLLHNGGLVKTKQFGDPKYVGDPLNAVKIFNEKEVDELAFFDIDASTLKQEPRLSLLREIAFESRMPLCYGGGVRDAATASKIINIGFEKVSISTAALDRPALITELANEIGSQSVVVTLDVKKNRLFPGYSIFTQNGKQKRKEGLAEFCKNAVELGAGELIINSIDRDGEMKGYDLDLAKFVQQLVPCPITVLGGAGSVDDMQKLIDTVGIVGVAAGSLFVFKGTYRAVLINYMRPSRLS